MSLTEDEMIQLPALPWMLSRIPKRKALVTFVPDGPDCPAAVETAMRGHPARWYPGSGGHRVLVLYEGGPFDEATFRLEPEAWDHEDCDGCGEQIPPMALCHVTEHGR
jgi:hypothetical protein